MKAKDFVKHKYPNANHFPMIDNRRMQTSYVILKHGRFEDWPTIGLDIFPNEGAETPSKAWTNAKKYILENENTYP